MPGVGFFSPELAIDGLDELIRLEAFGVESTFPVLLLEGDEFLLLVLVVDYSATLALAAPKAFFKADGLPGVEDSPFMRFDAAVDGLVVAVFGLD